MDEVKKRLMTVVGAFALGTVVTVTVLALINITEPENPDLADGATLAVLVFGVSGILVALRWWSNAGESQVEPGRFQIGFIVRVSIAEIGLLLGILGYVMTGRLLAPILGAALFLVALGFLALSLRRVSPA